MNGLGSSFYMSASMFRLTVEIKHVNGEHLLLQIPSALLRRPPQQSQAGDCGVWRLHSKPDKWSAQLSPPHLPWTPRVILTILICKKAANEKLYETKII